MPPKPLQIANLLAETARLATEYLATVGDRSVVPRATREELSEIFGASMPEEGEDATTVLRRLATSEAGTMATVGPHLSAMSVQTSYLPAAATDGPRDPAAWTAELSHRARGFAVWAALRSLGRRGVADLVDLVDRCCTHARRFADRLGAVDGVEVLNDVVLNQVLVRFGDSDEHTRSVINRVQDEGTCWLGGTVWSGRAAMRISVSNWSTTADDVDRSVDAIVRAHATI